MGSCWQPESRVSQAMSTGGRGGEGETLRGALLQDIVAEGAGAVGLKEAMCPLRRSPNAGGYSLGMNGQICF